jgi:hypothetical protein
MKIILSSIVVATLAMGAMPAFADKAWQAFDCQLVGKQTADDVLGAAEKWLTAARTMQGGEKVELRVLIPHATGSGEHDFLFVLSAPSFAAWGMFWDNYEGSLAHKIDEETDAITICPSSRLYENVRVEAK